MAKNTLRRAQSRKVEDWLLVEKNWKDIADRRLSKEDAATLATTALKFTVTAANIESAVEAVGRKWPSTGTKKSFAAYQLKTLRSAVRYLYLQHKIAPPDEDTARVLGMPWEKEQESESAISEGLENPTDSTDSH